MQPAAQPSSSQVDMLANLDDLLECSICYTPFQRPLQLNCGHSFCSVCVDKLCQHERGGEEMFGANIDPFAFADIDPLFMQRQFPFDANRPGLGGAQEADAQRAAVDDRDAWFDEPRVGVPLLRRPYFRPNLRMADIRRLQNERRMGHGRRDVQIRCPECRRFTVVPPEGLPVNYRLQDMISRLNISKNKPTTKKDLLKCDHCEEKLQIPSFFTCKAEICPHSKRATLCPTCAIRYHNGHLIEEIKVLTEQDIATAKDAISHHTACAHQCLEQVEAGFNLFASKAKDRLGILVKNGMKTFESIAGGLDNEVFTSMEAVQVSIEKAKTVADFYEKIMNVVNESVNKADQTFTELASEMTDFFKQAGFPSEMIKTEPVDTIEGNDVVVIQLERARQLREEQLQFRRRQEDALMREQRQIAQQHHIFELMRRQRADDRRDRDRVRHEPPYGQQLNRRVRERQVNIDNNVAQRMHARLERLNRAVREEEPEEPFHRPQTPIEQPLANRIQAIVHGNLIPQNRQEPRRLRTPPPLRVKEEIVTPPGSPVRQEPPNPVIPPHEHRRVRRRRRPTNDPNAPGPSNQSNAGRLDHNANDDGLENIPVIPDGDSSNSN